MFIHLMAEIPAPVARYQVLYIPGWLVGISEASTVVAQGALALDGAFEAPKGMVRREVNLHPLTCSKEHAF